ncbi:hypothetical protein PLCT2_00461 [Planctomycetaceae bacterium]|nr:hypothetical protein PLCT2_00461 [Planctomycetaceae bacterium]
MKFMILTLLAALLVACSAPPKDASPQNPAVLQFRVVILYDT